MLLFSLMQQVNKCVYIRYRAVTGYFELSGRLLHVCETCIQIQDIEEDGTPAALYIIPSNLLIDMVVGHIDENRMNLEACFIKEGSSHANSSDR